MRAGVAAVVMCLLASGTAAAETPPSMWDRAKRPAIEEEYQLHLSVQRVLRSELQDLSPAIDMMRNAQHLRALAMLHSAGAERSDNPLLRFDLAEVYAEIKNHARAAEIYKAAMRDFPNHPLARRSRFKLAIECGYIGDHECESRLYREIISQETEPDEIATPTLNLAEADMHHHDLREAIEGYREAWRLSGSYASGALTAALAQWGLAVALDRSGELREADEAAHLAVSTAQNHVEILRTNGIFFFPDYEVTWYEAISYAALARRAPNAKVRLMHWQNAERYMGEWVRGAKRTKDHWLPIAEVRLATYTQERKRAEAELLKTAPAEMEEPPLRVSPAPRAPIAPTPRPPMRPPPPIPKTGDVHL